MFFLGGIMSFFDRLITKLGLENYKAETVKDNYSYRFFSRLNKEDENYIEYFIGAYRENPKLAIKILLYIRDIKYGLADKELFKEIYGYLCKNKPEIAIQLIPYISRVGRFDDLFVCFNTRAEDALIKYIDSIFKNKDKNYSDRERELMGKWLPSINSKNKKIRDLAKYICEKLEMPYGSYRKKLSSLRKNIVENYLREKNYTFDYNKLPVGARNKYRKAFLRNDKRRYLQFCRSIKNKERSARSLLDVVRGSYYDFGYIKSMNNTEIEKIEREWNDVAFKVSSSKTLVVRDGSYSMHCDGALALMVADSFTIFHSSNLTGDYKNKFISLSKDTKLKELKGNNIYDKLVELNKYDDGGALSFSKLIDTILEVYKNNPCLDNVIEKIIIISDTFCEISMEIGTSVLEDLKNKYQELNLKVPRIVYWNINHSVVDINKGEKLYNMDVVNGFSDSLYEYILSDKPLDESSYMEYCLRYYDYVNELNIKEPKKR